MKGLPKYCYLVLFVMNSTAVIAQSQIGSDNAVRVRTDTAGWWAQVQQDLAQKEYTIRYNEKDNSYRAFNRENGIIGSLNSGSFVLRPRLDSGQVNYAWQASFETKSIEFDGMSAYQAESKSNVRLCQDTVDFTHKDLTEQYINNKHGIRQNFIIPQGPKAEEVRIKIKVQGLLLDKRSENEIALYTRNNTGLQTRLLYKDIKSWDASGRSLISKLEVEEEYITLVVSISNATYPITIDPISTTATTLLESNQAGAAFGYSVASAGDVNGDGYSDVIVGAYLYDNGQTDEGAAFIYYGSATGLSQNAAALLEANQAGALFGYSVASAGDVNGDGYSDVIVGAYGYDNGQTDEGAAFIYHGSASGMSIKLVLNLQVPQANAEFGWSVALAGDVNGDGYSDIIVGARSYVHGALTSSQFYKGAAFIYHGSASGLSNSIRAVLKVNQVGPLFGYSVASAGDVNGDGYSDVIVGALAYDNGQTNEGAAFIYHGSSTGLSTTAATQLESNQASAHFGFSVAAAGDVNGDGYSDVIVGAYLFDNGQVNEGAAFIYHGSASGLSTTAATQLESNQASASFGYSVASAGDVNGDGYSDVIVGARRYDNGGAAFIYHGNNGGANNYGVLRDYDDNLSSLYTRASFIDRNRGIGLNATSFLGRQKVKLAYETAKHGTSFIGSPITNGVGYTGIQSSYTDLGVNGSELKIAYTKNARIRVRIKFNPVTAITGQLYGPWRYLDIRKGDVSCFDTDFNLTVDNIKGQYVTPSGNVLTESGSYKDTIANAAGCDSIITLNLCFETKSSLQVTTSSDRYFTPSGKWLIESGTYKDTIANAAGCDSIINLELCFHTVSSVSISTEYYFYTSPSGKRWDKSGTYKDTIANAAGCDSIIKIDLCFNTRGSLKITISADRYFSPSGKLLTESGRYKDTIANAAGCDSIINLELCFHTVSSVSISTEYYSYTSPSGKRWDKTGSYKDTIANTAGCDSIITIDLLLTSGNINPNQFIESVYPNPGNGLFTFRIYNPESVKEIIIYDNLGKVVRILPISPSKNSWQTESIDLTELASGTYYWALKDRGNQSRKTEFGIRYDINRKFIKY